MDLLSVLLKIMMQKSSVNALSKKTGVSSSTITKLIRIGLPLLIIYLTKNAKSKEGATSLLSALGQHKTDKKVEEQLAAADAEDGDKILAHIFGKDKDSVLAQIASEAGASKKEADSVLSNISPTVLSSLLSAATDANNKKKQGFDLSDGFDLTDVMALVGGAAGAQQSSSPAGDLLGALLGGGSTQAKKEPTAVDLIGTLLGGSSPSKKEANGTELITSLLSLMG